MSFLMPSILSKYDSLTASNFPSATRSPRFESRAPEVVAGVQLYAPYVLFDLAAADDFLTFESESIEESRLTTTAYGATQAAADQIIAAVRFNGQNPDQNAGFDNGTLPALTDGVLLSMLITRAPVPAQAGRGKEGTLQFKTTMEHLISVQRS